MVLRLLYRLGHWGCLAFPRRWAEAIACRLADAYSRRVPQDRRAVRENLKVLMGASEVPDTQVREVFRNFGRYLVDFFRTGVLTPQRLPGLVRIEGLEHVREAMARGRGVVGVTAHLGNYELAGVVLAFSGVPVEVVVYPHQDPWVDHFFTRQREGAGLRVIPVRKGNLRLFFDRCLKTLQEGRFLGFVCDRDFFGSGIPVPFFGRTLQVPAGPAFMSLRTGAPIVPVFLVREPDGSYRFFCETPLAPPKTDWSDRACREAAVRELTARITERLAAAVGRYPTQWYLFQEFWRPGPGVII